MTWPLRFKQHTQAHFDRTHSSSLSTHTHTHTDTVQYTMHKPHTYKIKTLKRHLIKAQHGIVKLIAREETRWRKHSKRGKEERDRGGCWGGEHGEKRVQYIQ